MQGTKILSEQAVDFYPTPDYLVEKMLSEVSRCPSYILEPSAGKGNIVRRIINKREWRNAKVYLMEKDENLASYLLGEFGKQCTFLDRDFLAWTGPDQFDLIIANPPFSEQERHLEKALDLLTDGELVFLVNAEMVRNPYSKDRKEILRRLDELGADVEIVENAFADAERTADVDVAIIHVEKRLSSDYALHDGLDEAEDVDVEISPGTPAKTKRDIADLVAEYDAAVRAAVSMIRTYYSSPVVWRFLELKPKEGRSYYYSGSDLSEQIPRTINDTVAEIREAYWKQVINLDVVRRRMTSDMEKEFHATLSLYSRTEFNERNVTTFVLNVIDAFPEAVEKTVLKMFDKLTIKHAYSEELWNKNVHYFNGWKTNNAFKVRERVVIPIYGSYAHPFLSWNGWSLDYSAAAQLDDFDRVMAFLEGGTPHYLKLSDAVSAAFERGQTKKIVSTYFEATVYKKGTIHLRFRDKTLLRRLNLIAAKNRGWLPQDYGRKPYTECDENERALIDAFEGKKSYEADRTWNGLALGGDVAATVLALE